jgi:hypothetical protein
MIDGIKIGRLHCWPMVIHDGTTMCMYRCPTIDRQDRASIAAACASVVDDITGAGGYVEVVIADGATAVRAAVDETRLEGTIQSLTKTKIIDLRCFVHGAHLAFADFKRDYEEFKVFQAALKALLKWAHHEDVGQYLSEVGAVGEPPVLQVVKWKTFTQGGRWTRDNRVPLELALQQRRLRPGRIVIPDHLEVFGEALTCVELYIKKIEGNFVTLPDTYIEYLRLIDKLEMAAAAVDAADSASRDAEQRAAEARSETPNSPPPVFNPARILIGFLKTRSSSTFDLSMARLASVCTKDGLRNWRARFDRALSAIEDPSDDEREKACLVVAERDEMISKLMKTVCYLRGEEDDTLGTEQWFLEYLAGTIWPEPRMDHRQFWREIMNCSASPAARQFARIARILVNVPVSEASCERMGSLAEALFGKDRKRSRGDLVEAELVVRAMIALGNVL